MHDFQRTDIGLLERGSDTAIFKKK